MRKKCGSPPTRLVGDEEMRDRLRTQAQATLSPVTGRDVVTVVAACESRDVT